MSRASMCRMFAVMMLSIAGSMSLSACNTIEGAGKDIERGGEKLQNAAEDAKK